MNLDIFKDLYQAWNNDPAIMNSVSGFVSFVVVGVFAISAKLKGKEKQIKIEVGDVKAMVPVVDKVADRLEQLESKIANEDNKLDAIAKMFYTTLINSKMGADVKKDLTEQYMGISKEVVEVKEKVKEALPEIKEVINDVKDEVVDAYLKFKNQV